jgi:hypothetical protein
MLFGCLYPDINQINVKYNPGCKRREEHENP